METDMANLGPVAVDDLAAYFRRPGSWEGVDRPCLSAAGQRAGGRIGRGSSRLWPSRRGDRGRHQSGVDRPACRHRRRHARTTPLTVDGVRVGTLGQQSPRWAADGAGRAPLYGADQHSPHWNRHRRGLLALGAGDFLSYTLARPLQRLAERIRPLTSSQVGEQVPVEGPTEVRELAIEFNGLSQRLSAGEKQRQQMSSDIAHELRTPVTVLRGHLEAMMDGVYPLDTEHLVVAYDQTIHLARLVEDLRLLTQAEAGRLELNPRSTAVGPLVEAVVARFAPLAQDAEVAVKHNVALRCRRSMLTQAGPASVRQPAGQCPAPHAAGRRDFHYSRATSARQRPAG